MEIRLRNYFGRRIYTSQDKLVSPYYSLSTERVKRDFKNGIRDFKLMFMTHYIPQRYIFLHFSQNPYSLKMTKPLGDYIAQFSMVIRLYKLPFNRDDPGVGRGGLHSTDRTFDLNLFLKIGLLHQCSGIW